MKAKLYYAFGILLVCAVFFGNAWLRFTHPEMTETQLFTEYWYIWAFYTVAAIVYAPLYWWAVDPPKGKGE
jgi:hypothetical protein